MSSNLSRIAIGLSTAIGLAISVPGQATVYVADFPQTTIDRYTDTFDPLPLTPGNGAIFSGPGLVRPVAVAYGTGTLYWQSYFDGKVETVNLVTGVSSVFIPGVAVNREALGLAVVGNTLYEMIHSTGKVLEFNATTGSPLLILDALTGTGNDHGGLYVAPNGNIFVASYTTNIPTSSVVTELAPNGTLLNKFTSAEGLSFPIGLAVGPDGKLYVGNSGLNTNTNANPGSGFVEVFDLTDGTHTSFLSGLPDTLTAVAFTPDGKLLLGSKFTPTYVLCDPTVAMCGPVKSVVSPVFGDNLSFAVSEPASLVLLGTGLIGAALVRRRRAYDRTVTHGRRVSLGARGTLGDEP